MSVYPIQTRTTENKILNKEKMKKKQRDSARARVGSSDPYKFAHLLQVIGTAQSRLVWVETTINLHLEKRN